MNKKIILIIIFALIIVAGTIRGICSLNESNSMIQNSEENDVRSLVDDFGNALKDVSLLSPNALEEMEENYKDLISEDLLNKWKEDPSKALGRLTSSPWPERIEIENIQKVGFEKYTITGKIIEMTSTGIAVEQFIELNVVKVNDKWLIENIEKDWKDFTDESQGISFSYPESLGAQYIYEHWWPNKVTVSEEGKEFVCPETPLEESWHQGTMMKKINGQNYCISATSEGAAGSVYTEYVYSRVLENRVVDLDFVLRYPQCGNYTDIERTACQEEREVFNMDGVIDEIFSTMKLLENISWQEVENLVSNCEIKEAWQYHSKEVKVVLKNGIELNSEEPKIDDIINLVQSVQDKCGKIRIATE